MGALPLLGGPVGALVIIEVADVDLLRQTRTGTRVEIGAGERGDGGELGRGPERCGGLGDRNLLVLILLGQLERGAAGEEQAGAGGVASFRIMAR